MAWKPSYASVDDLKRHLRIPGLYSGTLNTAEDSTDDIPLAMALSTASRLIDQATSRQFGLLDSATAFIYTPEFDDDRNRYVLAIDDVMTTSGFVINCRYYDTGAYDQTTTAYTLYPINAAAKGDPWTSIVFDYNAPISTSYNSVEVTAQWGWSEVPETIRQATLIQAARIFKRRDAPYGVAGSPEMGNELRLLAKLDPDVHLSVVPFKKKWGAQ
jgi:hypothetical protein